MNTAQWLLVGFAALTSAAIGACAGRWWYGRRTMELLVRLDKLERARQIAGQHAAQARRQIEQLQKDIAAQHKARADARASRRRELNETLDAASDRTIRVERAASDAADDGDRPVLPAHGFADTQPMA